MTEHIIYLNQNAAPHKALNDWISANGLDPEKVACTELTINDDQLTFTEFVIQGDPAYKELDPRGGGQMKRHRTVPLVVPFPEGLMTNNVEDEEK